MAYQRWILRRTYNEASQLRVLEGDLIRGPLVFNSNLHPPLLNTPPLEGTLIRFSSKVS